MKNDLKILPPKTTGKSLSFVFSFNDNYCKYFAVTLKSLTENSKPQFFYDIVILSSDITERNIKLLQENLPQNFSLRFFNISDYISDLFENNKLITTNNWSVEMYYRIAIPLLMPDYQKVFYADTDIIFNTDISPIFDIDFDGKKLLAVSDSYNFVSMFEPYKKRKTYLKETLGLSGEDVYFNSGVLVFNTSSINPEEYLNKVRTAFKKLKEIHFPDQDILNYLFKRNTKMIEQKWNLQYYYSIIFKKNPYFADKSLSQEYIQAFNSPAIIHYTSSVKPWYSPQEELADIFWKYARKTIFYEEILLAMYQHEIINSRFASNLYTMLDRNKKIVFWGASLFLENFLEKYKITKKSYPNIIGIIDINPEKTGGFLGDFEIFTPEILKHSNADEIILTIINSINKRYEEVENYLQEHNTDIRFVRL